MPVHCDGCLLYSLLKGLDPSGSSPHARISRQNASSDPEDTIVTAQMVQKVQLLNFV